MSIKNPIILISGGTGVGTSTYALEIAKQFEIHNITQTDAIREAFRSQYRKRFHPILFTSTYLIGQTQNYSIKPESIQQAEIIRGYKNQAQSVGCGIEGIVKRAIKENIPCIIEGVHIVPGKIQDSEFYKNSSDRFIEYIISISEKAVHAQRFQMRQEQAPERSMKKYLNHIREIRWIHDYLVSRSQRYENITQIENSGSFEEGKSVLLNHLKTLI